MNVRIFRSPAGFSFAKASPTSEILEPTPAPALNTITITKEVLTALQAQLAAQEDTITQLKKQKIGYAMILLPLYLRS